MFSKNLIKLSPLYDKPCFFTQDVANLLGFNLQSARVFSSRYSKKGFFIKLRNGCYSLSQRWDKNSYEDYYKIFSVLRVPSYLSLLSALYYYEVTTQVPNGYFEGITSVAPKKYSVKGVVFRYYKIKKNLFRGFSRKDGFFIAEKEKAFADALYLYSFGKYRLDFSAVDLSKLDLKKLSAVLKDYPVKTVKIAGKICGI